MPSLRFHNSGQDAWSPPPKPLDPAARMARFGPIRPMETPSLIERLLTRH